MSRGGCSRPESNCHVAHK
eukprot:gene14301-biopygen3896